MKKGEWYRDKDIKDGRQLYFNVVQINKEKDKMLAEIWAELFGTKMPLPHMEPTKFMYIKDYDKYGSTHEPHSLEYKHTQEAIDKGNWEKAPEDKVARILLQMG